MTPRSATEENLLKIGIEPRPFLEWRQQAQATDLKDDSWYSVLPAYIGAQAKLNDVVVSWGAIGKDTMMRLGLTLEAAERAAGMGVGQNGDHRTPVGWAIVTVESMLDDVLQSTWRM
jgi:hypothetical protein